MVPRPCMHTSPAMTPNESQPLYIQSKEERNAIGFGAGESCNRALLLVNTFQPGVGRGNKEKD